MTRVKVGKHVWVNVSRRSLCDNCLFDLCPLSSERRRECEHYRPIYVAFKKCRLCGEIFEVFSNINSLDHKLCPECNKSSIRD